MAEEIHELLEVQGVPTEEGAGIDADNAEDVVIDFSWLSSMGEKLASTKGPKSSPSFTICRALANMRKGEHAAYDPQIVSIGPFHRGMAHLQAMEEHKWRYLNEVLAFGIGRTNLEEFLKKMKEIEKKARNCYSENIQMSSMEFVEMMVLDGCFIIFLVLQQIRIVHLDFLIYHNESMLRLIHLDMLSLENQLPFFVLECLWELIGQPRATLWEGALASFEFSFSYELRLKSPEDHDIHHLLHLLHLSLKPGSFTGEAQTTSASGNKTYDRFRTPSQRSLSESKHKSQQPWNMIPSATELLEAGVGFQLKRARSFLEVRFEQGQGLVKMPCLWIYDYTHILFWNLMAFEQCFPYLGNHCTSYCVFIDFLVNTPRDVSILREAGVIRSGLGSNEEVALLFNKLCKEIVLDFDCSYLASLFEDVNRHTSHAWPKWRAKLVHDNYFRAIISLAAAVTILILTLLQTYFSVFAYLKPPKP